MFLALREVRHFVHGQLMVHLNLHMRLSLLLFVQELPRAQNTERELVYLFNCVSKTSPVQCRYCSYVPCTASCRFQQSCKVV